MAVISKTLTLETTFSSWTEVGDRIYEWIVENFPNLTLWRMRNNTTERHTYTMWYGSEKLGGIDFGNYTTNYFHLGPFRDINNVICRPTTQGPVMTEGGSLTLQLIDVDGAVLYCLYSLDNNTWYVCSVANFTNVVTNEPVSLMYPSHGVSADKLQLPLPRAYITADTATVGLEIYPSVVELTGMLGGDNVANISTYMYGNNMFVQMKDGRLCTLVPNVPTPWSKTQGTEIVVGENTYMFIVDDRYVRIS